MKKSIGLFVIVLIGLLWVQCSPPDDDYYWSYLYLEIEDAIQVENRETYTVGDTLFFEINFSRYLPEEGESTLLDVYETSGATEFNYNFSLLKYSAFSESYQGIWWDEKFLVAEKGGKEGSDYSSRVFAVLNTEKDVYESRIGLILAEEGEFKLDFEYLRLSATYNASKPSIELEHIISEENPLQLNFTVNQ